MRSYVSATVYVLFDVIWNYRQAFLRLKLLKPEPGKYHFGDLGIESSAPVWL
jgi:hypothetical protein